MKTLYEWLCSNEIVASMLLGVFSWVQAILVVALVFGGCLLVFWIVVEIKDIIESSTIIKTIANRAKIIKKVADLINKHTPENIGINLMIIAFLICAVMLIASITYKIGNDSWKNLACPPIQVEGKK